MRTLVLLLALGCAHQNANPPPPAPPLTEVELRACQSCRHDLELCRLRDNSRPVPLQLPSDPGRPEQTGADPFANGAGCMDEFMRCMRAQQLDSAKCQGLN